MGLTSMHERGRMEGDCGSMASRANHRTHLGHNGPHFAFPWVTYILGRDFASIRQRPRYAVQVSHMLVPVFLHIERYLVGRLQPPVSVQKQKDEDVRFPEKDPAKRSGISAACIPVSI